jgi:hypothetical protein
MLPAVLAVDAGENEWNDRIVWLFAVVLIDVAHVYATLFRTYFDARARQLHRLKLVGIPAILWLLGVALHLADPLWFWRVFAYIAVFHFIKQHIGFLALYQRLEASGAANWPGRLVLWLNTLGPIVWWHAHLPRAFSWFVAGDFIEFLRPPIGNLAPQLALASLALYALWRIPSYCHRRAHPMVDAMIIGPAVTWHLGMVYFDHDHIFTLTNVLPHGIAYMALVWQSGGRRQIRTWLDQMNTPGETNGNHSAAVVALIYLGSLAMLALGEEALWDHAFWRENTWLFGDLGQALAQPFARALFASLLMLPQATHYVLDRYIWRAGAANPNLATDLNLAHRAP